jgi:hypothetical protein
VKDKTKLTKIKLPQPDLSHIKPPTKSAAEMMIANLHKAGKEKQ